jgi:hypothetical protein
MILVMCVITASFSLILVDERRSFSKHLQRIFGVSPWMYQLVNFCYDFITYGICFLLIILVYWSMGIDLFTFNLNAFLSSLVLFVLFGFCVIPFVYMCQMAFLVPALSFISISVGTFFAGVVCTLTIMLLENLQANDEGLELAHSICAIVFLVFPQYNLGMAIYRLNFIFTLYQLGVKYLKGIGREELTKDLPLPNPLVWELMGKHCLCLFTSGILYWLILLLIEYRTQLLKFIWIRERFKTRKMVKDHNEKLLDEDVRLERNLVDDITEFDDYGLVVKRLSKVGLFVVMFP